MPRHLLWCVLCECVHGVPADVCVNEDKFPDPAEDLGHAGLQLYAAQRVHAQVEEVQVGDVGHDGADLATHKHWQKKTTTQRTLSIYKTYITLIYLIIYNN